MPPPIIALVAFDRISPFHLSVPCVIFGESHEGLPAFDLRLCAAEAGPLTTTAGFSLQVPYGLDVLDTAQIIVVPSWRDPSERPPRRLLDGLRSAHQRGAQIVGLCLGAYVLAEAGLLDGRRATTHWAYAQDFAQRYRKVRLEPDVLYIDDGTILTSAGTAASMDCCLHMLRQMHGSEITNRIARRLVMAPHRQGGQAQFIEQPVPASSKDARLGGVIDWVRAHLNLAHDLDTLATKCAMSRRSFTRHFRQSTSMSVTQWLLSERLAFTQRLLENTDQSVEAVAELAGFGAPASLRRHFKLAFGVSPQAWRQTFKGAA